ncbi:MAG: DNA polymerase III subunit delta [Myxococcales bacterium]|nr:DNA polymerase III subunit delta [Myxococcales bacterium]
MEVAQLIAAAEDGRWPHVVVLAGSERFFVDRAVAALKKAVVGEGDGFNEETFHGKGGSATRIIEAARTLPMMATARFVLARAIDQLAAAELDRLTGYLDDPSESTCLVMTADKLDGRSKFAKRAKKAKCMVEAAPLKASGLRSFITSEVRRRKLRLDADAGAALMDAIGTDVPALDDALERLSLYVGDSQHIDLAAVEACVSRVRVESIWALVDAVGMRNRKGALRASASLLAEREPPLRILAMVARQLRMVARVGDAVGRGMNPQEAARAAGAPPFKARELATASRRLSTPDLARAFAVLAEADMALKGSKRPPDVVLQTAIMALTAP